MSCRIATIACATGYHCPTNRAPTRVSVAVLYYQVLRTAINARVQQLLTKQNSDRYHTCKRPRPRAKSGGFIVFLSCGFSVPADAGCAPGKLNNKDY